MALKTPVIILTQQLTIARRSPVRLGRRLAVRFPSRWSIVVQICLLSGRET